MSSTPQPHKNRTSPKSRVATEISARKVTLQSQLELLSLRDHHRLTQQLRRARSCDELDSLEHSIDTAVANIQARTAAVPLISYPKELPVSAAKDVIAATIQAHQVVIIAGETGSGKTTQIPKICLELGRGIKGLIGHTQPRRLAARTVAERIAEELGTTVSGLVGYAVRFTDHVSSATLIKLMTDGILLAEIRRDPMLRNYDTLIIDEAHERSLNIDFLLGYLKSLLPLRPDLKVIITSATIDPQRFAEHFSSTQAPAPIVEVSGRTFPVDIRYRPLTVEVGDQLIDLDPIDGICQAVQELHSEGDGDILVFLSGEREIRDTAEALRELKLAHTEIIPLYARLSSAEQHKVFEAHSGKRIVLSTNVAETSLTVPGIRYVIDPGTARISRYSVRTKVQRLPIEPISQASARQRAGRCGRVAEGICIRLYSEEEFNARPTFTEPEILRTNLASVILNMTALGLGEIAKFPFVQPPDPRAIRDGVALLEELGAISSQLNDKKNPTLTSMGKELSTLPVDPRLGRMLIEANKNGCLPDMLIIVSALSIQDVRERPADHQQTADQMHARFHDSSSDFLSYINLWNYLSDIRDSLSSNQFRKKCKNEFLHWIRIREWQDLHGQLSSITRSLGWSTETIVENQQPNLTNIHISALAGLLSHIGIREADTREFIGARGSRFAIFPGSALAKKPPRWVVATELVETHRLWARTVAKIEPEWVEKLAGHLVKRTYSEPHWSVKRASAMAYERVTLYGIPVVTKRLVHYSHIDPELSRELFIRHALVQGEWTTEHKFFYHNRALLEDVEDLENRSRRRDLIVDDETLFDFYDHRVSEKALSAKHFDSWWKTTKRTKPQLLHFTVDTVTSNKANEVRRSSYPSTWRQGSLELDLTYQFEPGTDDDGVTIHIPIALLASVRPIGFDWLVPGMRTELVTSLIKTLPKQLRRAVVPAPDFAAAVLASVPARSEPLLSAMSRELSRLSGVTITMKDFSPTQLPKHLQITFVTTSDDGNIIGRSKTLRELQTTLSASATVAVAKKSSEEERPPAITWTKDTLGSIDKVITRSIAGQKVTAYPSLVIESQGVAVRVLSTAIEQQQSMHCATIKLLMVEFPISIKTVLAKLTAKERLTLSQNPHGSMTALFEDCHSCAVNELLIQYGGPVWTPHDFLTLTTFVRNNLALQLDSIIKNVVITLKLFAELSNILERQTNSASGDVREQVSDLIFPGFVASCGATRLNELPRYLRAAIRRLESLPASATRDSQGMDALNRIYTDFEKALSMLPEERAKSEEAADVHWLIEELRISLFAQNIGTLVPVSEKRVRAAISKLR
ncbi:MAG: ATP-dependent RNA helicase HrpA [Mycobacteriaceae bacterium]